MLFDTGVTPDGALHNLAVLGIDLGTIQAIILSHGHTDHTHGLGIGPKKWGLQSRRFFPV